MRKKSMVVLVIFVVILTLPFAINAANGHIFSGTPSPIPSNASLAEYNNAIMDEYAVNLPKPLLPNGSVDIDYMRNHMNILKQPGQSTTQCASCHADRTNFCDKCHNYVGIHPEIDY